MNQKCGAQQKLFVSFVQKTTNQFFPSYSNGALRLERPKKLGVSTRAAPCRTGAFIFEVFGLSLPILFVVAVVLSYDLLVIP